MAKHMVSLSECSVVAWGRKVHHAVRWHVLYKEVKILKTMIVLGYILLIDYLFRYSIYLQMFFLIDLSVSESSY
jgi:hypothetical protein